MNEPLDVFHKRLWMIIHNELAMLIVHNEFGNLTMTWIIQAYQHLLIHWNSTTMAIIIYKYKLCEAYFTTVMLNGETIKYKEAIKNIGVKV